MNKEVEDNLIMRPEEIKLEELKLLALDEAIKHMTIGNIDSATKAFWLYQTVCLS